MDIFKYAKEYNADYYDPYECVIYKVQNYNKAKRLGLPNNVPGIEVVDLDGNTIGYVPEKN